jgi:hypothetical protein
LKKDEKTEILAHPKKYFFSWVKKYKFQMVDGLVHQFGKFKCNNFFLILDRRGLRWTSAKPQFYFKRYDSGYKQEQRNKTRTYLNIVKVAILNIFS